MIVAIGHENPIVGVGKPVETEFHVRVRPASQPQTDAGARFGQGVGGRSLEEIVGGETVWIAVESKVRSGSNRQFSASLVRKFLEESEPWGKGR